MNLFRREIKHVGRENAEGDLDGGIFQPALNLLDDPAKHEADEDSPDGEPEKLQETFRDGGNAFLDDDFAGKLESQQASGVVDEALAFKDVHDALRQTDAARNGSGGNRICGRNDRTQQHAQTPVKAGKDEGCQQGNAGDGKANQTEGKKENGQQIGLEVTPGGVPRGGIQQRRQEDEEDEIRIELNVRNARDKTERKTADDHDDG